MHSCCTKCGAEQWLSVEIKMDASIYIYDLECYPDIFTASFKHVATGERALFEISTRKNQYIELIECLILMKKHGAKLVGFNNIGYDYPMLHYIITAGQRWLDHQELFYKSHQIIKTPWENRFSNIVRENEVLIPQIDLFKIHHFDNESRRTSLKLLEFNMRSQNIQDLPFKPGEPVGVENFDQLISYNNHDVDETEKFYFQSLEQIRFREELTVKYGKNFINHNDTKIGKDFFIMELEENLPGSCYIKQHGGPRIPRQTPRDYIRLSDVIFQYVNFKRVEFQWVKYFLQTQIIHQTKGVFEHLNVPYDMMLYMNPSVVKVKGLVPDDVPHLKNTQSLQRQLQNGLLLEKCKDSVLNHPNKQNLTFISGWENQSGLNCILDGFQYDFGTGGIHGSIESSIVQSDNDFIIYDWDVASYYPNLAISNQLYPEHLSREFCYIYKNVYEQRKQYAKGSSENAMLKLALNGVYGDSNNRYSPFYDPQYTMSVTINGQLLLCLLAETLLDIPGLQMIQINTDGLTVKCPRGYVDVMKKMCNWWEEYTQLTLESAVYDTMFIRDVNNYIAVYENGDVKRKGAYEYEREWHQNHSALIIPKAVEAVLVRGEDLKAFVYSHADIHDFMYRTKVGRSDQLVIKLQQSETVLQNITRYYVSNDGGELIKISPPPGDYKPGTWKRTTKLSDEYYNAVIEELKNQPPSGSHEIDVNGLPWDERINTKNKSKYAIRRTSLNADCLVAPCNDINDANWSNINFDHYVKECEKLIYPLLP